jgi:hypothetical protein
MAPSLPYAHGCPFRGRLDYTPIGCKLTFMLEKIYTAGINTQIKIIQRVCPVICIKYGTNYADTVKIFVKPIDNAISICYY